MSNRTYGGLIWTNHALERLENRRLSQELAWQAYRYSDNVIKGKQAGTWEYQKRYQNSLITLILKQNEHKEWIVLSAWIDPPLQGTQDYKKKEYYREYQKAGFWGKFWVLFKQSLGI